MRHKPESRIRRVRHISHDGLSPLQRSILDNATTSSAIRGPMKPILPSEDSEVPKRDLIRVPVHDGRHAEVAGIDGRLVDVQLEVAAVVQLAPLQLAVGRDEGLAGFAGECKGDVLAVGAGG